MKKLNWIPLGLIALSTNLWGVTGNDIIGASGVEGGLIVHVGSGSGELTAQLRPNDSFLVQGLDTDPGNVAEAKKLLARKELTGTVSVSLFDGSHLPYADNLVNLLVCDENLQPRLSTSEIQRVLAPRGVVLARSSHVTDHTSLITEASTLEGWQIFRKPRPKEIDDWTHYLHGPDNNAVARDTVVGPPRHMQWIGSPRFARSHDHLASVSAVVSAAGRVFSIIDEGSIAFAAAAPCWKLVARDAFNGIRLWEQPIADWEYHLRDFRSGPADIARRLVAVGDTVYVTLGYGKPVTALDAATGKILRTFEGTAGTREILCGNDALFLVLGEPDKSWKAEKAQTIVTQKNYNPPFAKLTPPGHIMRVASVSASTGKINWMNEERYTLDLMPATLTLSEGRIFFHTLDELICLDATNGRQLWTASRPIERQRLAWSSPTVVVFDGVVYTADRAAKNIEGDLLWLPSGGYHQYIKGDDVGGELIAYDARNGERLWTCPAYEGFNSAVDIFVSDGLLWTGRYAWGRDPGITQGRDPKTGEVKRTRPSDMSLLGRTGHARCHRAKATSKYLIEGRRGIDMIDIESGKLTANFWVRGVCAYGVMPANGLIYAPQHSCACSVDGLLKSGFMALAHSEKEQGGPGDVAQDTERLTKGPAFAAAGPEDSRPQSPDAWPTYRSDNARFGSTKTTVSLDLKEVWRVQIGGQLTPAVSAAGILLVVSKEKHIVHARDAESGEQLWTFTAGARIDSPPTIFSSMANPQQGKRCIFGCRDGYVYCVRLADGELAWRFRAAPGERRIVVDGQLESTWPVPGNILVSDGKAYCVAGRNSFLDGGMTLYQLDAVTGKLLKSQPLEADSTERDSGSTSGFLPDVLATDGQWLFMRGNCFDFDLAYKKKPGVSHLWSSVGFLDRNWWHRTYWQYGTTMGSGWGGWNRQAQSVPVGRLLVTDGTRIYGYSRSNYDNSGGHVGTDGRCIWGPIRSPFTFYRFYGRELGDKTGEKGWAKRIPVLAQALLLTPNTLFIAGPEDPTEDIPRDPADVDPIVEAMESDTGGSLLALSPDDGRTLGACDLDSPPVFDGMIAANGRLYLSTKTGEVICLR